MRFARERFEEVIRFGFDIGHTTTRSFLFLFASILLAYLQVPATGEVRAWDAWRQADARGALGLLDSDRLGERGGNARISELGSTHEGDAEVVGLV